MTDWKSLYDLFLKLAGIPASGKIVKARSLAFTALVCLLLSIWSPVAALGAEEPWQTIPPDELALKDDPLNPGAHAVILYREVFSNHKQKFETYHTRIKILTEKGYKYANIEIPTVKGALRIENVSARTVQPDGRVVPFRGEIFENTVVKTGGLKVAVKTFTLSEVGVGSIVEYRYTARWEVRLTPPWFIQSELSLLRGRFSARPTARGLRYYTRGLPSDIRPLSQKDGTDLLEVEGIPAFVQEEHSLPEEDLKGRILMIYPDERQALAWSTQVSARFASEWVDSSHKEISKVVKTQVAPEDPPETKLRKLYARVQQVRNLSFSETTGEGKSSQNLKNNRTMGDVLKHGYGQPDDINLLFVALAKAAGFAARPLFVWHRDQTLVETELRPPDSIIADVLLEKDHRYFDPGTPGAPFGLLPWGKTDCVAETLGAKETTPVPVSADAVVARKAELRVTEDGALEGHVSVSFHRREALQRRRAGVMLDESARRENFEKEINSWFSSEAEIEAIEVGSWEDTEAPIEVRFDVTIPDFAVSAGQRLLLPSGIFQTQRRQLFQNAKRIQAVYFGYPWQEKDEVVLELPEGYTVGGLPVPQRVATDFGLFETSYAQDGNALRLNRKLVVEGFFFAVESYPALRDFFAKVKTGDDDQIVLAGTKINP